MSWFELSTISFCLQLRALSGCDYVRIHFKSLNDNGIYFNNDPYVGLGFFHHQTFVNKDTRDWDFDSTCHKYNPLEALMFAGGNLCSAKLLSLISIGINGFVFFGLFFMAVMIARGMKVDNKARSAVWSILVSIVTATSLALQAIAFDKIHDEGGICDRDSYFPYEWDEKFPFQIYPQYAYFKFFHDCSFGPDGQSARASINFLPLSSPYYALPLSNKSPPAARTNEPLNEHEILSNRFVYFHFQFWRFLQLTKFKIEFKLYNLNFEFDVFF